ncbi:MAG: ASKHA domain-containing protein [Synergistaceae bacterium]|nr:ASKHA domain-containing protein [Synergistaceae bacterium]
MRDDATIIKVLTARDGERDIDAVIGANLLDTLRGNDIPIAANCGGRGTCGKCGVVIEGVNKLACQVDVAQGMRVEVVNEENSFVIITDYTDEAEKMGSSGDCKRPCVAIDIGTTTVVLQLIDADSGKIVRTRSFLNGQRPYGEDVVTRIQYSGEGDGLEVLNHAIRSGLNGALSALCADAGIDRARLEYICVAGNTTMIYLLLGYQCQSLGVYPFTPQFDVKEKYTFKETFGSDDITCPVYIIPWASTYVGGDITAGYLACCAGPDEIALLVDMGTNGEMMLWAKGKVWCCSTAAGPAFEGGGIEFGTGSIPGAISKVDLVDGKFECETIGGASPVGICGSGVLDAAACLLHGEFVDASGRMDDPYFDDGAVIAEGANNKKILFTQKDMRELQLAKSAVRAGVEIMLSVADLTIAQLDAVYLAGGFGQKLRLESAVTVGLLPGEMSEKTKTSGNSSLGGCVKVCCNLDLLREAESLTKKANEIHLNEHPDFQNLFMEHMMFPEEE